MINEPQLRRRLLGTYACSEGARRELERTALRGESVQLRQVFAHAATNGAHTLPELQEAVMAGSLPVEELDPDALARLAAVAGLQNAESGDTEFAIAALHLAVPHVTPTRRTRYAKLLAELLFESGRYQEMESVLAENRSARRLFYRYLAVDARSPFVRPGQNYDRWLTGFNRPLTQNGLIATDLEESGVGDHVTAEVPFNKLTADVSEEQRAGTDGPLVSVIMTTYRPVRADVLQSARSILNQTWQNLELLIVDDASGPDHAPTLNELQQLDSRVRVISLDVNGGTYAARNAGLAQARGEFVTGQDADDWSHPQRIEVQVQDLLEHPELPGNQVYTVNMTENLVRIRRGYLPFIPSAPTLMVRTHLMRELGGYLTARKAADNEMRSRVAAYTGVEVHAIRLPLIFMRILPDSLSRADFRPGWQHPARRIFWSSYEAWHAQARPEQLRRHRSSDPPIDIPARFTQPPEAPHELDVVLAADWCEFGALQADMLEELRVLREAGLRVGILHMESPLHPSDYARTLCGPVQDLVSSGDVTCVLADEEFRRIGLLIVRSPELLQFMPRGRAGFTPAALVAVAEQFDPDRDDAPVTYLPTDCTDHGAQYFGRPPLWVAGSDHVQNQLASLLGADLVARQLYRSPLDTEQWAENRPRFLRRTGRHSEASDIRPIIGAWSGTATSDWPDDPDAVRRLLPTDGSADVRLYGKVDVPMRVAELEELPAHWLALAPENIDRRVYYRGLDVFLHYPQGTPAAPERAVCEALASGCLVIMSPHLRTIYGDAAVYSEPARVQTTILGLMRDRELAEEQRRRAATFTYRAGGADYLALIDALSSGKAAPRQEILT